VRLAKVAVSVANAVVKAAANGVNAAKVKRLQIKPRPLLTHLLLKPWTPKTRSAPMPVRTTLASVVNAVHVTVTAATVVNATVKCARTTPVKMARRMLLQLRRT
jgi:hypothetical protein